MSLKNFGGRIGARLRSDWGRFVMRSQPSVAAAAAYYGVSEATVYNWIAGACGPSGEAVLHAYREDPAGFDEFWRAGA